MGKQKFNTRIGSQELSVELSELAGQANGHVVVRLGDTTVLVTAVMSPNQRRGGDFFPLMVEYEEKFYAAGKILGSRFVKRESRPSEEAILVARLIDRTIRPRFDLKMRNEVQVVATVLSLDDQNDPDIAAMLGASLALSLSDIPWAGPIAGVRVGGKVGGWIVNPTFTERASSDLDIVVAGTKEKINMIEAAAKEIPEEKIVEAIEIGRNEIQKLIAFENEIITSVNPIKISVALAQTTGPLRDAMVKNFSPRLGQALWTKEKSLRNEKLTAIKTEWLEFLKKEFPESGEDEAELLWEDELDVLVHRGIIESGDRPDGRKPDQLRGITAEAGVLPRVHGSGLFVRGETQALSTLTLGSPGDQLVIESMEVRTKKHFMHHYNFPPYSTGEVKPMRGPGRREIGHGALAERALAPLIPSRQEFPYTIRVVSEILSSNGSSSMASVCGSTLALFDAGVPMQRPVAGIAMGLMMESESRYRILTDIQGPEDHYGDMDFKAAGTTVGITAMQMDVKIEGLNIEMLKEIMVQSRQARLEILNIITKAIPSPRPNLSPYAPRITTLKIDPAKIGALIGPGGKMINSITAATGVAIEIEDDGTVFVTSENETGMEQALGLIKQITREFKPGDIMEGTVSRLFDFGAMVEIGPKQEGLVHISELAPWHVNRVEDIVNIGDRVEVVVKNIDDQKRLNLSIKGVPGRYSREEIERGETEHQARASSIPPGQPRRTGRDRDRGYHPGQGRTQGRQPERRGY